MTTLLVERPVPTDSLVTAETPDGEARGRRWVWSDFVNGPLIAIVGVAARLVLMPFTSHVNDDVVWYQAAVSGTQRLTLYRKLEFPYPPLWGLLLQGLGRLLQSFGYSRGHWGVSDPVLQQGYFAIGHQTVVTSPVFNVAFKTVLLGFDAGVAWLLFALVVQLTCRRQLGLIAAAAWFLNPFVIFESAVHGSLDTIVAFFVLAAIVSALSDRSVVCGAALAAGGLTKVAPFFLIPLFLAVIVARARQQDASRWSHGARRVGALAVGGLGASALVLAPQVGSGGLASTFNAVFARLNTGSSLGGLNPIGVVKSFSATLFVFHWIVAHNGLAVSVGSRGPVLAALGVAVWAFVVARRDPTYALLAGAGMTLVALLFFGPLTNPQWILWVMPVCIAVAVVYRRGANATAALSFAPLLVEFALLGLRGFLAPMAEYTNLVSPAIVASSTTAWVTNHRILYSYSMTGFFDGPATIVAVVAFVSIIRAYLRSDPTVSEPAAPQPPTRASRLRAARLRRALGACIVVALIGVAVSEVVVYRAPQLNGDSASAQLVSAHWPKGGGVDVELKVRSEPGAGSMRLVAVPVDASTRAPDRVDVYVDRAYPILNTNLKTVDGVYRHVQVELGLRGYRGTTSEIDTTTLALTLLDKKTASRTVVVIGTGVLPVAVLSRSVNLLTPWLRAGGTLVWIGPKLGFYEQTASPHFDAASPQNLHGEGDHLILGASVYDNRVETSPTVSQTPDARALSLQYRQATAQLSSAQVLAAGGQLVGYTGSTRTALGVIPVAKGRAVLFGGLLLNEFDVAHDVAQLISSGLLDASGPVAEKDVDTRHSGYRSVSWHLPSAGHHVLISIYAPQTEGVFFTQFRLDR